MSSTLQPCATSNQLHAGLCLAISDPIRIHILYLLAEHPYSVSQLVDLLKLPQSTISRHLRTLRDAALVNTRREGRNIHYSLGDSRVIEALDLLRNVLCDRMSAHAELLNL